VNDGKNLSLPESKLFAHHFGIVLSSKILFYL
jgi:hypothetical protein